MTGFNGRTVWVIKQAQKLHVSQSISEDMNDIVTTSVHIAWATANSHALSIDEIHFRSERQTLRRLPRSKAVIFTVRTYFEPVTRIAQEPHIPGRLAEAIRNWDETVSFYKGKSHWDKILLPYLDEQDRLQKERGIVDQKEEGSFPY
jgi:hypothetical protein